MLAQHEEAERSIAGAILVSGDWAMALVADVVRGEDFSSLICRVVVEAGLAVWQRREPVDIVTIEAQLRSLDQLKLVGGLGGLSKLGDCGTLAGIESHARRVRELAQVRRLAQKCRDVASDAESAMAQPSMWLEDAEAQLLEVTRRGESRSVVDAPGLMKIVYDDLRAAIDGVPLRTLTTGHVDLNEYLGGGLFPGELVIVGARASMGKTAWVLNMIARNVVLRAREWILPLDQRPRKQPALVFSLEMQHKELGQRLCAFEAATSFRAMRRRNFTEEQFRAITLAMPRVALADLHVDDAGGLSLLELQARARRWRCDRQRFPSDDKSRIGLIAVDYLQLLRGTKRVDVREQEVAELSRGLKALAKELDCVVVALSQLNRAVDNREDHRPQLADLRESGAIEQDADVILFPFREAYYLKSAPIEQRRAAEHKAEVIIGKARNGELGTVHLHWDGAIQTFGDAAWRP